ncbi:MAG: TlpA family protein disulfide reductase [Azonexus sp.]
MKSHLLSAALMMLPVAQAPAQQLPGVPVAGQEAYQAYEKAQEQRAFAIAPGGAWGWHADADSPDIAEDKAISACKSNTHQKCVLYARNNQVVFNAKSWPGLWGPYATTAVAAKAPGGTEPGQRMADIGFRDAQGKPAKLSGLKGKVVILHFWGSWCPPCRKEMPDLVKLHKALKEQRDIVFVLLQIREPFETSRRWAQSQHLELPLADSGSHGESDANLYLANNKLLPDREIARSFPTSYVLDKHGLVIFSHIGPVHDWPQYEAFLKDAAKYSGK